MQSGGMKLPPKAPPKPVVEEQEAYDDLGFDTADDIMEESVREEIPDMTMGQSQDFPIEEDLA